jgi:asparagine synthetase B (glutamine-hydrolysing)
LSDYESSQTYKLIVTGAVLHLRGSLTPQPLEDDKGNVLVWNGEVFDGIDVSDILLNTLYFHE